MSLKIFPTKLNKFNITILFIIAYSFILFNSVIIFADEIRKITPPNLDEMHLGQKILCYRPMRHGSPKISVERKDSKVIVHNYGHGGSGWTLAPGCAEYTINLLLQSPYAGELKKDTPITIVGAGVIGLFTAYNLDQKGFKNITIIAEKFQFLTSHNAGGLLAPVSMDNNPEMQKIIDKIGIEAYKFYSSIAKKTHKDFKQGAVILPTYFETKEVSGLEPYVGKVMNPAKNVILDFGNGTRRKMISYDDGIFIDTAQMMAILTKYLKTKKIKFVQKKVTKFSELDSKFIINCTGLGSQQLGQDKKMVSVQGHLIMLKKQNPADLQHMIIVYLDDDKTKFGQKIKRSFYMFPKHLANSNPKDVGVIGGTFVENATPATPNTEEFNIIIQNAKKFYGIDKVKN